MSAFSDDLQSLLTQYSTLGQGTPDWQAAQYIKMLVANIAIKEGMAPFPNSYEYPEVPYIATPVGIDVPIQSIRSDLQDLPWLRYSFGRAYEFTEKISPDSGVKRVPKVYVKGGEYLSVLPNDFWPAYSFIMCDGPEEWDEFTKGLSNPKKRRLAIVFWFDLRQIVAGDYIATDGLKREAEAILKQNGYVSSIESYVDERAEDVFKGYINSGAGSISTSDDDVSQYLMYPFAGFRFTVQVNYFDNC